MNEFHELHHYSSMILNYAVVSVHTWQNSCNACHSNSRCCSSTELLLTNSLTQCADASRARNVYDGPVMHGRLRLPILNLRKACTHSLDIGCLRMVSGCILTGLANHAHALYKHRLASVHKGHVCITASLACVSVRVDLDSTRRKYSPETTVACQVAPS